MVFLFIFIIIFLINIIIFFSKINIQLINLNINSETKRHLNKDYRIIIKLYILKIIPVIKINITKEKMEKLKIKDKIKNIELDFIKNNNNFDKDSIKAIKKLKIAIKKINLNIKIGTENAALTAIVVPVLSTIIAIFIRKKVKKLENQIFIIKPVYHNENEVNISISGIFEIKMKHIINMIYMLNKKEGVKKYERTSNRRAYGYSYE